PRPVEEERWSDAMLKGLYEAAAGMKARLAAQEIIASNLANAGTTGFQREIASIQAQRGWEMADGRWLMGTGQTAGHQPSTINHQPSTLLYLRPFSVPDTR